MSKLLQKPAALENAVDNAPRVLVTRFQHPNPFRGRFLLYRLLTDPIMDAAWKEIEKRLFMDKKTSRWDQEKQNAHRVTWYPRIWRQIFDALLRSRAKPSRRAKKRDHFRRIARDAGKLASSIADGPLDRLSYEFFPADWAQIAFQVPTWSVLGTDKREQIAYRKLTCWPSLTDLLQEVAHQADRQAQDALTKNRIVDRDTFAHSDNYFIRSLSRYFRTHLKGPMDGTLARIATVVLSTVDPDKDIDEEFVKRARRHARP